MSLRRGLNGALAGSVAAGVWALQQPLDKMVFSSGYDDVELLGKVLTRGPAWPAVGAALHLGNGAAFGAVYALARTRVPGPALVHSLAAGVGEHVGLWPLTRIVDRHHPARRQLTPLAGNRRAFSQGTWRHILFGLVLGVLESRLNGGLRRTPESVPVASNGHGRIEAEHVPA